ncbi:glycerophosphodiester phosphodiesterase GDPD4 [Cocos nucifera]|uniref:glycerophosphodiester phosphodiesterase n=1 Tax=Cocos nucifera TaxID=13894 RepID=A0A8K0I079_COCNU|nr:glycerophosphodiester phosphodiesterase GDPD4 [Cocos nucifera]
MRGGLLPYSRKRQRFSGLASKWLLRLLLLLAFLAVIPPIFFQFRLRRFNQMEAYRIALDSRVDCMEIDVSRSSDGVLFALHDRSLISHGTGRDLQRMSGNSSAKVGYLSKNEIKELDAGFQLSQEFQKQEVPTVEDALALISNSVRQVILDAKVGPPSYEKGLAKDILSVVGYTVMKDPSTDARNGLLRMKGAAVAGVYHPLIDQKLMRILHW